VAAGLHRQFAFGLSEHSLKLLPLQAEGSQRPSDPPDTHQSTSTSASISTTNRVDVCIYLLVSKNLFTNSYSVFTYFGNRLYMK